jgi:hypothetical protein
MKRLTDADKTWHKPLLEKAVLHLGWALFLCYLFVVPIASGRESINLAELLKPETKHRALRDFLLRDNPKLEGLGWRNLEKFKKDHPDVEVLESNDPGKKGSVYVVISNAFGLTLDRSDLDSSAYPKKNLDRLFRPPGPTAPRLPAKSVEYFLFDAKGTYMKLSRNSSYISEGLILDLNGDGRLEVLEKETSDSVQYFTVRYLLSPTPVYAAAYDSAHGIVVGGDDEAPPERGFAVEDSDSDHVYDIVVGLKERGTVTREAVVRWNPQRQGWRGPASGNHFHELNVGDLRAEVARVGKLFEPDDPKTDDAEPEILTKRTTAGNTIGMKELESLPSDQISKPYSYHSLNALSNDELLSWMSAGRTLQDLKAEQVPATTLPEGFWDVDPKIAALQFVEKNRPPGARSNFLLAIDDMDGKPPPEEGTLTISDGPSGCFSPDGAFEYFLRCSRVESYLIVGRCLSPWYGVNPLDENGAYDLRRVPIDYKLAVHLIQVVWWLDRVRSKQVGDHSGGGGLGSTSDGFASFRLDCDQGEIEFEGFRYAGHPGRFMGVGEMDSNYTRTACLNLIVLLICRELPSHLGEKWHRYDVYPDQPPYAVPSLAAEYDPSSRARLQSTVDGLLRLFIAGKLEARIAGQAVAAAQALALVSLAPELERAAASLPPPTQTERRLTAIDQKITELRKRLGSKGTRWIDFEMRRNRPQLSADRASLPGLGASSNIAGQLKAPKASSSKENRRFASLDALYSERGRLEEKESRREKEFTALRRQIDATLKWMAAYDDPEQLYQLAVGDQAWLFEACRRLRILDPERAAAAIDFWTKSEQDPSTLQALFKARDEIAISDQRSDARIRSAIRALAPWLALDANADAQVAALIKVVQDVSRDFEQRSEALQLLIPQEEPRRFTSPAVDESLIRLLESKKRDDSYLWATACRGLAQRGGGQHWDRIAALAIGSDSLGMARFSELLPSLAIIALKEPEPYRAKLKELLLPQLTETHGNLQRVFWTAWITDQREIKGDVEKLATSAVSDVEGALATTESNHAARVQHRFHAARQVASIWNEEDPVTSAKLLIAAGLEQSVVFGENPGRERLHEELQRIANGFTPEQRGKVRAFIEWARDRPGTILQGRTMSDKPLISEIEEIFAK